MGRPAHFLGLLAAALGSVAVCLAPLAWQQYGAAGVEALAGLAVACFLPGAALPVIARRIQGGQRDVFLLLIGTLLRGGIVIIAALAVLAWKPELRSAEFFLVLALLYCIALAVETRQLLASIGESRRVAAPASSRQPQST